MKFAVIFGTVEIFLVGQAPLVGLIVTGDLAPLVIQVGQNSVNRKYRFGATFQKVEQFLGITYSGIGERIRRISQVNFIGTSISTRTIFRCMTIPKLLPKRNRVAQPRWKYCENTMLSWKDGNGLVEDCSSG